MQNFHYYNHFAAKEFFQLERLFFGMKAQCSRKQVNQSGDVVYNELLKVLFFFETLHKISFEHHKRRNSKTVLYTHKDMVYEWLQ